MSRTASAKAVRKYGGFTLLEVLIALSVLAILMVGLLKIAANNSRNLWLLENTTIAEQVAQNRLLMLYLSADRPERDEGWESMAGRRWYWKLVRAVQRPFGKSVWRYQIQVFLEGDQLPYVDVATYLAAES